MKLIEDKQVKVWGTSGILKVATSISAQCPFCAEKVIFSLSSITTDQNRNSVASTGICPGCGRAVFFWTIKSTKDANGNGRDREYDVFMYPASEFGYPHPKLPSDVPEPLQKALFSTIDSLNSQNFPATAVGARRTLEGIFKYRVEESKRSKSLFQLIDEVKNNVDLAAPLESLSHVIRAGGNLGAHFDAEHEPSEAQAKHMVELLDYLISYLYVLPSQITELEKSLARE
ncbi:DUF4145 domain-containing protein [Pseudomonas psychrophila]|uniref:DUF4145 domain-containing protein n=1 Tax=Pseudomonas psychrophila TaxID=122355 RepID=UPI0012FE457F|nr:DUF4145 domain-containing protein [Pseudomonas psychrophila]